MFMYFISFTDMLLKTGRLMCILCSVYSRLTAVMLDKLGFYVLSLLYEPNFYFIHQRNVMVQLSVWLMALRYVIVSIVCM